LFVTYLFSNFTVFGVFQLFKMNVEMTAGIKILTANTNRSCRFAVKNKILLVSLPYNNQISSLAIGIQF
jgi:hypothetical protein